jgi:hypothetical protein
VHEFERYPVVAVLGVEVSAQMAVEFADVDVPQARGVQKPDRVRRKGC